MTTLEFDKAKEIEIEKLRTSVTESIDPVQAFNAWNLSIVCRPITVEQDYESQGQ